MNDADRCLHCLFQKCCVVICRGAIPPKRKGEEYPPGTKLLSGIDFKTSLYQGLKSMWNVHDDKGADKVSGQKYNGTEFKPFKPEDMSIVDYRGRHTRENLAKFERKRLNSVSHHNVFSYLQRGFRSHSSHHYSEQP